MHALARPSTWIALVLAAGLAGCAAGVKRSDDPEKRTAYFARGGKISPDIGMSLNKAAQAQLSDNLKFDQDKLLDTVKRALRGKELLAPAPAADLPTMEIVITDIRVRSSFSAIMFGFMAGDDRVAGEVIARDPTGQERQRFEVSTSYALGGIAGGMDEARLGWVYERFAEELVKELTGEAPAK